MPSKNSNIRTSFKGFRSPNYTQVPDELFDELLPDLSGAELKALLYIIRRTFGFKRDSDSISLSQMLNGIRTHDGRELDRGVGLSKPTLLQALRSLQEKNIIQTERRRSVERGDEPTVYCLLFTGEGGGQKTEPPVVKKFDQGGGQASSPGGWSKNLTTQETVIQETVEQHTVRQQTDSSKGIISFLQKPDASRFSKKSISNQQNNPSEALDDPDSRPTRAAQPSLQPISELISHRQALAYAAVAPADQPPASRRRKKATPEATPQIEHLLSDFSAELHDEEHTAQNISQAARLWHASGRTESAFCQLVYEARSRTKQYQVKKRAKGPGGEIGLRNKMPYFFSVLKDLLGMKPQPGATAGQAAGDWGQESR